MVFKNCVRQVRHIAITVVHSTTNACVSCKIRKTNLQGTQTSFNGNWIKAFDALHDLNLAGVLSTFFDLPNDNPGYLNDELINEVDRALAARGARNSQRYDLASR